MRRGLVSHLKKYCFLAAILCLWGGRAFLPAQTAAREIETLLRTPAVTYAQAARFVLEASETMATPNQGEAFRFALARKWLPQDATPGTPAKLSGISLLLMNSFKMRGGIIYSVTNSSHFAYRELVYNGIIQGRSDPSMKVSGEALLFYTNRILAQIDEAAEAAARKGEKKRLAEEEARRFAAMQAAEWETSSERANSQLQERGAANAYAEATSAGVVVILSDIRYLANPAELTESEKEQLREIAQILKGIAGNKIMVAGHTAAVGTETDRRKVSRDKAQAAASYLVSLGVRPGPDITSAGYGDEWPIADNATAEGRAANQRIEILITESQE
jgi:outer membrane protein OmpA-like peptidoglycan-associated protein